MGRILMVNGSPRAPKSNSKQYLQLFQSYWKHPGISVSITSKNHRQIWDSASEASDILLVFPLYADGIPSTLLDFLKAYEAFPHHYKATVHIIVNCGFLESEQNAVAVKMIQLFCKENGFSFGSCLCIGSGEAILGTPFRFSGQKKYPETFQGDCFRLSTKTVCYHAAFPKGVCQGFYEVLDKTRASTSSDSRTDGNHGN